MFINIPFVNKISFLDKIFFVKNLALIIKSGLPLREGILILREQSRSRPFRKILSEVIKNIDNGQSLAASLSRHPGVFDNFYINMIMVGEESGTLEESLEYLSSHLVKAYELLKKVRSAMIYPMIILVSTFGLVGSLAIFILPRLLPLFEGLRIQLPLPTRILIFITGAIQNYGHWILLGIFIFIVIFALIFRIRIVKKILQKIFIFLPILGRISKNTSQAQFARTLAALLKSGVSVTDSLDITSKTAGNLLYQEAIRGILLGVQAGRPLSSFMSERQDLFFGMTSRIIQVGEKTGNLEDTLFYLAEFYEKEVDDTVKNLSSILEPALMIIIGLIVAFIAISIIMPIYQFTRGLRV